MTPVLVSTTALLCFALALAVAAVAARYGIAARRRTQRRRLLARTGSPDETQIVGFFHPYWCATLLTPLPLGVIDINISEDLCSNAGGGGERVLWTALACMQREYPASSDTLFVVYTGDIGPGKASAEQVLAKAEVRSENHNSGNTCSEGRVRQEG